MQKVFFDQFTKLLALAHVTGVDTATYSDAKAAAKEYAMAKQAFLVCIRYKMPIFGVFKQQNPHITIILINTIVQSQCAAVGLGAWQTKPIEVDKIARPVDNVFAKGVWTDAEQLPI